MYRKIKYLILEEPTVEDLCKMLLGKKVNLEQVPIIVKPKPIIEPIEIEKVKLEELDSILKSIKTTDSLRYEAIKEYAGGVCMLCAQLPTRLVSYDLDGAQLVERYCDKCFEKQKLDK